MVLEKMTESAYKYFHSPHKVSVSAQFSKNIISQPTGFSNLR